MKSRGGETPGVCGGGSCRTATLEVGEKRTSCRIKEGGGLGVDGEIRKQMGATTAEADTHTHTHNEEAGGNV